MFDPQVAVKLLRPDLVGNDSAQLLAEAQAMARLFRTRNWQADSDAPPRICALT